MVTCAQCGVASPDEFRFCPSCASPLAPAPLAREERKVVSVLFADLVGFTADAERMDPEDVRALLGPYHARLRTEIERYGGTVEKFIGDAVMALFGAPVAHEDDPERAVRAALAIRDWITAETRLHVRIGVATGEALVTLAARPAEGEGMASGDVVNTAARLQAAAPVDGIIVSESTWRATDRAIEYAEHEPVVAKGKAEPVVVWQAVQARSRLGVDVARRSTAPLVGRERELEILHGALRRAIDEAVPQLVTLVGVPGIGKSRLLAELLASVDEGDRLVTWRQGRCLPYGEGVSYWALGEMVKAQAGMLETDPAEVAARKLAAGVDDLIPDESDARWVESHLRPLVGLERDDASGDTRGEAFAAWRRFIEALGERRPAVVVFEDLHWADEGLLDFVDSIVDWLTDVPVLIVATARPELLSRRPTWGGGKANATTVSLSPLTDDETARLVHTLLGRSVLAAEVQATLLERAGGNPLYAEEFSRLVGERGRATLELPGSVQGIIAARLDGLDAGDKALLQDAAVVGKVFWSGVLAALGDGDRHDVEQRLHGLERRELVRRERKSSVAGEVEYAFRHVLVRDVAYGSIPRSARAERHRQAADWIEALGRPDDHGDLLAHHYLSALELARAAGTQTAPMADAAAHALRRAADRSLSLNAFPSAIRFYDEALAIGLDHSVRPIALFRLGTALHRAADERRYEVLEQARDALMAAGDVEMAAEAAVLLAEAHWHAGHVDLARQLVATAQELVADLPGSAGSARVLAAAARLATLGGRYAEGLTLGREALRIAEAIGLDELVPHVLIDIGGCRHGLGDKDGRLHLERAIELALAANDPVAARGYNNLAVMLSEQGDLDAAIPLWREGLRVAERLGNRTVARFIEGQLSWLEWEAGRWEEALALVNAFIASCDAGAPHILHSSAVCLRASIEFDRGQADAALADATRALELARDLGDPDQLVPALAMVGLIEHARGQSTAAEHRVDEILACWTEGAVRPLGAAHLAVLVGRSRDVLAGLDAAPATAVAMTKIARKMLTGDLLGAADDLERTGTLPLAADVRLLAAQSLLDRGRGREADEQLRQALAFYRSVGATPRVGEAEALLTAIA